MGNGVLGEVLCWFEVAMSTGPLRVENTLWNALAAEVTDVVNEIDVYPKGMSALKKRNADHIQYVEMEHTLQELRTIRINGIIVRGPQKLNSLQLGF